MSIGCWERIIVVGIDELGNSQMIVIVVAAIVVASQSMMEA